MVALAQLLSGKPGAIGARPQSASLVVIPRLHGLNSMVGNKITTRRITVGAQRISRASHMWVPGLLPCPMLFP